MTRTDGNLPQHEWIGLDVEVARGNVPQKTLCRGVVVGETRNTVMVRDCASSTERRFPKSGHVFSFTLPGDDENRHVPISGSAVRFRPEDRVKRLASRSKNKSRKRR